jgi:hypothetical protein
MNQKEITICGHQVKLMYCAASEQGFEDLSGKSIIDIDFTKSKDVMNLSVACIIAAYTEAKQEPPIKSEDILYHTTSKELADLYMTVINLRSEWYGVPNIVADQLQKEAEQMTDAEKEEAAKNAPAPTTDTVSS